MSKYSTEGKCHFPSRHVGWRNNSDSFSFGVSLHLGGDLVQPYLIFNISWKHCPGCMAECTVKSWAGPWFVIKIIFNANKQVQMNLIRKRRINRWVFSQSEGRECFQLLIMLSGLNWVSEQFTSAFNCSTMQYSKIPIYSLTLKIVLLISMGVHLWQGILSEQISKTWSWIIFEIAFLLFTCQKGCLTNLSFLLIEIFLL